MIRVVYYARVSTEEEKQLDALKTQCQENEAFIDKMKSEGWVLVDKYIDEGKSATTTNLRDEFQRLLSDIERDIFDVILIKQIDRGWRNLKDWKSFEEKIYVKRKRLFLRLRNDYYNLEDDSSYIATNMDAIFSEWASRNLSKKMNTAHQTRMGDGRTVVTNGKIWGYKQINGELVIDEKQADTVRFIFNQYISGKGFRTIKLELDEMGILNQNNKPFALTTLRRIIRQEKYKGTLVCGKRHKNFFTKKYEDMPESAWSVHNNRIPVIIEPEIWEKANKILDERRKEFGLEDKRKVAGYFSGSYVLSGKIKCAVCGRPYYHSRYSHQKNDFWECRGYREFGKNHPNGCSNCKVQDNELNNIVKEVIFDFWKSKDSSIDRVLKILDKVLKENNFEPQIKKLKDRKEKVLSDQIKLLDLFLEDGLKKEIYNIKSNQLEKELSNIEAELTFLEEKNNGESDKKQRLLMIKEKLNIDLKDKDGISDELIKSLVEQIIIKPDFKVEITLNGNFTVEIDRKDTKYQNVATLGQD